MKETEIHSNEINNDIEFKCHYDKYFEYVPLSEIEKYIEFDREVEHKINKKYLDELTEEIKVNGITYPITLEVCQGKGLIVEGNHRIAVAKRLGIKYIPVRVVERSRPVKGTIYENKVKELPSRRNMEWAKVMYGVSFLDSDNSAAVHGFTKVEPKYENGGQILTSINGNKSNLTKTQYELVKTPEFIKFFGNWEVLAKAKLLGDNIKGFYKNIFKGNEEHFLFEMAMQANSSEEERQGAIDVAGKELIELALELYPNVKLGDEFKPVVSKVVDSYGYPLVCYHGSNMDFGIFKSISNNLFFSDNKDVANSYRNKYVFKEDMEIGINEKDYEQYKDDVVENSVKIYEVFLNIRNPKVKDFKGDNWLNNTIEKHFNKNNDGFIAKNIIDGGNLVANTYVAFSPNQIKLSDGTNTKFDSNNTDIRFEKGGEVLVNDNFIEWFNGSKVIDELGNPKIVYHGTNRSFNVFDSKEIGQGTGNFGHYGYGFYFSDDIREAKGYGKIVLECYLNIKKPFTGTDEEFDLLRQKGITGIDEKVVLSIDFDDMFNQMKSIDKNAYEFMRIAKENGIDNAWRIYIDTYEHPHDSVNKVDLNDLYNILEHTTLVERNDKVPDYVLDELKAIGIEPKVNTGYEYRQSLHWITDLGNKSKWVTEVIKELGYDGVIMGSEYVAFYPEQIKLSDGTNTDFDSENPDIRFEKGGKLIESNDLKKWFGKSKIVDADGNPKVLYHGTSSVFTVFDNDKRDIGFHFGNLDAATQRGEGEIIMPVYLKMENPLELSSDLGAWDDMEMLEEYLGESNYEIFTDNEFEKFENVNDVRNALIEKGYDGIIYENSFEKSDNEENLSYIVFNPNQIRIIESEKVTFDNFYKNTKADFKEILQVGVPKRKPDFISDSGSKYWYTSDSVIRQSDHWTQMDTCEWLLDGKESEKNTQGICKLINFATIEKFASGGILKRNLTYLGEVGGDKIGQKSSLEKAKSLEKQGISGEQIRQETGWFLNPHDKKWRFEISDKDFVFIIDFDEMYSVIKKNKHKTNYGLKLKDAIKHDKLFIAYPEIGEIYVNLIYDLESGVASISTESGIVFKYNFYGEENNFGRGNEGTRISGDTELQIRARKRQGIFAHEIQHLIQIREGMGGGSTVAWQHRKILRERKIDEGATSEVQRNLLLEEARKRHANSSGEIESMDVEKRLYLSDEDRLKIEPLSSENIDSKHINVRLEPPLFKYGGDLNPIDTQNFHKNTIADFKEIMPNGIPKRNPDFIDELGSKYWFTNVSIIRQSNHWGDINSCNWTLDGKSGVEYTQGICQINNFKIQ